MARKNINKPIIETDRPGGNPLHYWRSAKAAADFYQMGNQVCISYNVKGITKQAKGHYFRYATKKEIADYEEILRKQQAEKSAEPTPIAPPIEENNEQVEIIPEAVERPDAQADTISAFDRLLQESKKKFNENSI